MKSVQLTFLLIIQLLANPCRAFTGSLVARGDLTCTSTRQFAFSRTYSSIRLAASRDPIAAEQQQATSEDKNGKKIAVGSVVRVAVENMKAYQVPAKGQGKFNENKEFVPLEDNTERGTRNLVLPVGMRGVVTKVYDVDDISANFPIQVKFIPGQNNEEGYDPPVAFLMHFDSHEVECV